MSNYLITEHIYSSKMDSNNCLTDSPGYLCSLTNLFFFFLMSCINYAAGLMSCMDLTICETKRNEAFLLPSSIKKRRIRFLCCAIWEADTVLSGVILGFHKIKGLEGSS